MKKTLLIFVLCINTLSWCQDKISGTIIDAETKQPIAYVNLFTEDDLKNNTTGSMSNEIGAFTLNKTNQKVTFSHINYEEITLDIQNLTEIKLVPKKYILDEIVVSNQSPKDYLKKILDLANTKIEKNTLFKTYCREIVKVNNDITKYADAMVDYYVKKGNGKSNVVLSQSRALKNKKIDSEDENNIDNINSIFKLKDYVKDAYRFESIENLIKSENYEFERKIRKEANGNEYEYIEIIPNENSDNLLNTGYIVIDPKTKNIIEFKIYTSEKHLKNAKLMNLLICKARINRGMFWSKFKMINNQYILVYNKKDVDMYIKMGKRVDHTFNFKYDVFVYEFRNNVEMPDNEYNKKTIYQAGTKFIEEYWQKYNVFPLEKDVLDFIKTI